jgi:hypothetical protein
MVLHIDIIDASARNYKHAVKLIATRKRLKK